MGQVATIGLDLAKSVSQAHGVDEAGAIVVPRKLRRLPFVPLGARSGAHEIVLDRHGSAVGTAASTSHFKGGQ
jgi:hypothetical protein